MQAIEDELKQRYAVARLRVGDDQSLDRMLPILEAVGNPHDRLKVIHIAGTSGKTSTTYYCAALLHAAGASVGMTISPHVDTFRERLQVNGAYVSEEEWCRAFSAFMERAGTTTLDVSYYELFISFVYWYFADIGVDYAVMETGLGGMYDCTNVAQRPDKVCAITDINYDHMNILGNTLELIAAQKAGIIHAGNQVFLHPQDEVIMDAVYARANAVGANVDIVPDERAGTSGKTTTVPLFQQRNWSLAYAVCEYIARRDSLAFSRNIRPEDVVVPGRMQIVRHKSGSTLIIDGAHNRQKVTAFVTSFHELFPGTKAVVLLSLKEGKETEEMLEVLSPITDHLIITSFTDEQDFPIRSEDPADIAAIAGQMHIPHEVISGIPEAFDALLATKHPIKIVVGSLYLVRHIRSLLHG